MKAINYISKLTSIDSNYIILIIKTIILILFISIIKRLGINILKKIKDNKQEYIYTRRFKLLISIINLIIFIFIWGKYLRAIITLISVISAAFTIAIRDLIFNFFCGIYIKVAKPFEVEDRI